MSAAPRALDFRNQGQMLAARGAHSHSYDRVLYAQVPVNQLPSTHVKIAYSALLDVALPAIAVSIIPSLKLPMQKKVHLSLIMSADIP